MPTSATHRPGSLARRFACLTLAVAGVAMTGCEGPQRLANQQAEAKVAEAEKALLDDKSEAAQSLYDAAAATPGISNDVAVKTRFLQARLNATRAVALLRQAEAKDLDVARLLAQVRMTTAQVSRAQAQIKSDLGFDPAPVQEQLKARIAEAQGSGGKAVWSAPAIGDAAQPAPAGKPEAGGVIRSLAAIDAEIARLQAAIKENREQAKALADQKNAAAEQGDSIQQKATGEKDQQSVDDFVAGADAHKKAADVGIEIDKLDAAAAPLQADLATLQGQHAQVQKAIDDYTKQIADLDEAWKATQSDIDAQKQVVAAAAGGSSSSSAPTDAGGGAPAVPERPKSKAKGNARPDAATELPAKPLPAPDIATQARQIAALLADAHDLREKAAGNLKDAVKDFDLAAKAADLLRVDLGKVQSAERTTPTEKLALAQLQETFSAGAARLASADAERELGLNYAAQALTRNQMNAALRAAQAALADLAPDAIKDALAAAANPGADDLAKLAGERLKSSIANYEKLKTQTTAGPGADQRKYAAMAGEMVAAFDAMQLQQGFGDSAPETVKGENYQATIDDLAKQVADKDRGMLPAIPNVVVLEAVAAPLPPPTPAPTATPAPSDAPTIFTPPTGTAAPGTAAPGTGAPPPQ